MKPIKNMRELELMRQNLHYKVSHLEEKMIGHSEATISSMTDKLEEVVFDISMKILMNFLFKRKKKKKKKNQDKPEQNI